MDNDLLKPVAPKNILGIFGMNLGIFCLYQVILWQCASTSFMWFDMIVLIIHYIVMFVFSIINFTSNRTIYGIAWLVSLLVVALVGFGSCWWITDQPGPNN